MVWTPAHFWAALLLREDYRAVGIPMLPVVKGPVVTARAIKTYGWITVLLSGLGVFALPSGGVFYGVMLLPYNGRLLQLVDRLSLDPDSLECQGSVSLVDSLPIWSVPAAHSQSHGPCIRLCPPGDAASLPAHGASMSTL